MKVGQLLKLSAEELEVWEKLLKIREDREHVLRAFLASWGLTQAEVAERIGVHTAFMGQVFSGKRVPVTRLDQLEHLGIPRFLLPDIDCDGRPKPYEAVVKAH